jgi:hypothetical protein
MEIGLKISIYNLKLLKVSTKDHILTTDFPLIDHLIKEDLMTDILKIDQVLGIVLMIGIIQIIHKIILLHFRELCKMLYKEIDYIYLLFY